MPRRARLIRILLGFLFAPLTPVVALVAIAVGSGGIGIGQSWLMFMIGVPSVYAAAIVLGIPMFLLVRWRKWNDAGAYISGGVLIGLVLCVAYAGGSTHGLRALQASLAQEAKGFMPFVVTCSTSASFVFWMIVRPDRFDASVPPAPPAA